MAEEDVYLRQVAAQGFDRARQRARRVAMAAALRGRENQLLPFEAIRAELQQQNPMYQGVRQIPMDKIVGSVGRYHEFTRKFLPLNEALRERWVRVGALAQRGGWSPIEVFQVGDVYFVRDGNHRVAVARQMGNDTIEAAVWQFPEDVEIGPQDSLDEVLIRLGERNFMTATHLDEAHPDHNIRFTAPGRHSELLSQIEDLRDKLSLIDDGEWSFEAAAEAWYEMIYLPTVQIIQDSTLLADFPGRTEADLFAWLSLHRDRLSDVYGEYDNLADLSQTLADRYSERGLRRWWRLVGEKVLGRRELPPLKEGAAE